VFAFLFFALDSIIAFHLLPCRFKKTVVIDH